MQKADDSKNTLPEKIVHQKSTNNDENVAFFWENNILKRKWKSKSGIKSGTQDTTFLRCCMCLFLGLLVLLRLCTGNSSE
jgi:hypothetical protein